MTVKELREYLGHLSESAVVTAWDPDMNDWAPISGFTYHPQTVGPGNVKLQTDDNEDEPEVKAVKTIKRHG